MKSFKLARVIAALTALLAVVDISVYCAKATLGSDHQDAPAMIAQPGADITDMYVFPAKNPKDVVFALDVHPLIPRGFGSSVSFDPGVLYQIKIDTTGDYREHTVLQFKATGSGPNQTIALYGPAPTVPSLAARFSATATGTTQLGKSAVLPGGMKFFAGVRRDPFFFDLAQFFKIVPDRNYKLHPNVPPPSATCFRKPGIDTLADFNVLSFIVEMPRSTLANATNHGRINVWATTSIAENANTPYIQVERWGRPAVKEALEAYNEHDISNRAEPYNDPTLSRAIYKSLTTAKSAGGAGRSPEIANALVHVLVPDEMQVNLNASGPATYLAVETKGKSGLPVAVVRAVPDSALKGFKDSLTNGARLFGGRDISSPVISLSLGAIYGSIVPKVGLAPDDRKETPCLTADSVTPVESSLDGFPYLPGAV